MNKTSLNIIKMYEHGYRANKDGTLYSPYYSRAVIGYCKTNDKGAIYRYVMSNRPDRYSIPMHRFIAYCKFGAKIFEPGIVVRHLNSLSLDNSWDNIAIGTVRDNNMDKSPEVRLRAASMAGRKYEHLKDEIFHLVGLGHSHANIRKLFNIPKSTFSYIINKKVYNVEGVDYGKRSVMVAP